ncbi:hypothetical protein SK128_011284 [Halocaridina rubra]|uniref:Fucolectin tachylectin-4 pentraxin-1 domain-containing protein n=1 Tax=Halocaridina rubra TaxID=373956 RepID=A0AAN8XMC1_HALRR
MANTASVIFLAFLTLLEHSESFSNDELTDQVCSAVGTGGINLFDLYGRAKRFPPTPVLEEVAFQKKTYASPEYMPEQQRWKKEFAVDGNDATYYHSALVLNPWWLVDLGEQKTIYQVLLLSRQDCCPERFHDVEIRIGNELKTTGDFNAYKLIHFYTGPYSSAEGFLQCSFYNGITGRYLSIQIKNSMEYLQLNTVRVYAARKAPTHQNELDSIYAQRK